jgi:hypothetical protein
VQRVALLVAIEASYLSRNIYIVGFVGLLSIGVTGCIIGQPKYPGSWSPLKTSTKKCVDVTGTYENIGQSKGVDAVEPPKLDRLLFPPFEGENHVSTVQLDTLGASIEAVATLSDGTTRSRAYSDVGACTALKRSVKDPNSPGRLNDGGVIGVTRKSFMLYRAEDGALIVKSIEKSAVLWLIIPIGSEVQYWYRFPEKVAAAP